MNITSTTTMTNNTKYHTNYFTKRAVCFKHGLERVNYGQTGCARTDASTGENHCWFIPDGEGKPAIKLEIQHIFFDENGYENGLKA